ncbi:hypothetical protein HNR06_002587 [Nocardiopsis arvandica]|uniref:Uncharacterized protein n=1 Tax=Nocardiopsis sinuspersici TaxID=501010 RepID=A0A7Z0BIR5_9ACTN|nr:hypothetical protein [Nocardiopsis sinuspersici]NYH52998.1 hypothetical protein [Nocardiopsis sinuspersici]
MPAEWDRIDGLLFSGRTIQAAQTIREQFGPLPMRETIRILGERFEHLRDNRPDEFRVSLGGYWDGFYS